MEQLVHMTSSDPGQNHNRRKGVGHSSLWVTNSYFPLVRSFRRVFFYEITDETNLVQLVLPEMASCLTAARALCSPYYAQYLGNPHHSRLGLGPLPEVLLDVRQSQESPVGKESLYVIQVGSLQRL